jgi:hypothetical protein
MSDLAGSNMDYIKKTVGIANQHYPERSYVIIVVNAPFYASMGWKMLKPMVHPNTQKKVRILSPSETLSGLQEYIDISQIPEYYGGQMDFGGHDSCLFSNPDSVAMDEFVRRLNAGEEAPSPTHSTVPFSDKKNGGDAEKSAGDEATKENSEGKDVKSNKKDDAKEDGKGDKDAKKDKSKKEKSGKDAKEDAGDGNDAPPERKLPRTESMSQAALHNGPPPRDRHESVDSHHTHTTHPTHSTHNSLQRNSFRRASSASTRPPSVNDLQGLGSPHDDLGR